MKEVLKKMEMTIQTIYEITNDIYSDEEINKKRHFYYRPNKLV